MKRRDLSEEATGVSAPSAGWAESLSADQSAPTHCV